MWFNDICRLCASQLPMDNLKTLEQLSEQNLDKIIWQYLQIKMDDTNEKLPCAACTDCCNIIERFHNFTNQVQNAQRKLMNMIESNERLVADNTIKPDIEISCDSMDRSIQEYFDLKSIKTERNSQLHLAEYDDDLFCDDIKIEEADYDYKSEDLEVINNFNKTLTNERNQTTKLSWIEKRKIELKCYKCENNFRSLASLEEHFQHVHDSKTEYMCTECKALFQNVDEFESHFSEHYLAHNKRAFKIFKCEICDKEFNEKTNFTAHQYTHSGIKRFECEICGKKFTLKQHMEIHKYTVCMKNGNNQDNSKKTKTKQRKKKSVDETISKREIKWKCCKCELFFHTAAQLQKHFDKAHNGEEEYVCIICVSNFNNLNDYEKHLQTQHLIGNFGKPMKKYKCHTCHKIFNHKTNYDVHQLIHSGIKNFACDVCGKKFALKQHLNGHKLTHLKANITYDCEKCDRKYKTFHLLQVHLKVHLRNEEPECDICHKRFTSMDCVKRHKKKVHDDIEEFICEQCGKHFRTKYNLDVHVKTHTTETPYTCDECLRSFKSALLLRRHKSVHSEIKPFSCEFCGKSFRLIAVLNKHKKTHTNELPFECDYCKKCFRTRENLKVHYRQHTGEKPYSCTECNCHFTNSSNFIKHLKGRHNLKNFSIANNHQYPFINRQQHL